MRTDRGGPHGAGDALGGALRPARGTRAPLIGRAAELGRLSGLLDAARAGVSAALLVVGEPGVGKTTLLDAAVQRAEGFRVLRTTGFETESNLAFAGLQAVTRPLAGAIEDLPQPQATALAGALGLGPPLPPGDRFTVYAGALTLLSEAADDRPLLVVVDDAHWLDTDSLDTLAFVARRLAVEGIAILMAAREEPEAALERLRGVEVLRLDGLDGDDAVRLVRRSVSGPVEESVAQRLARETAGNPLAVVELAAGLSADQLAGRAPLPDPMPAGPSLSQALAARLAELPQATVRALLIAAAGAGDPRLVADALQKVGLTDALTSAERAGLVDIGPEGTAFRHPLVRAAAYSTAEGSERREVHRVLAGIARARGADGIEALAHHLAAAAEGPDEEAAGALLQAGRRAASRMGYVEALDSLRRAASLTEGDEARAPRLMEAGTMALIAGRADVARECLVETTRIARDPALAGAARAMRARLETLAGNGRLARDLLVAEAELLRSSAPAEAAALLADAVHAAGLSGDLRRAVALGRRAEDLLDGAPQSIVAQVVIARAAGAGAVGDTDLPALLDRVPDPTVALREGDPYGWTRLVFIVAPLLCAGRHDDAQSMLETVIGMARAAAAPSMLPYPLGVRGEVRILLGDWEGAAASASEAVDLAEQTGQHAMGAYARSVLARLLAARGDEAGCRAMVHPMIEDRSESATTMRLYSASALGLCELGVRRLDAAVTTLKAVSDVCAANAVNCHPLMPFAADLIEAAVLSDQRELAGEVLARFELQAGSVSARTLGALERCRGLLADDPDAAAAHLARAVALETEAAVPFEAARSRLLLGERLRALRRRAEAVESLTDALLAFERLEAVPWARRAAEALGALGSRPRVGSTPGRAGLTPQELQVARAATGGLSNREIAAQLFLSVKTVEFHMGNAFSKLGVRSRAELAARLAGSPAG